MNFSLKIWMSNPSKLSAIICPNALSVHFNELLFMLFGKQTETHFHAFEGGIANFENLLFAVKLKQRFLKIFFYALYPKTHIIKK